MDHWLLFANAFHEVGALNRPEGNKVVLRLQWPKPQRRHGSPQLIAKGTYMDSSSKEMILAHDIHALSAGSGSLVVLLPGWPETGQAYSDVLPALAGRHRVVVWILRALETRPLT